MAKNKNNNKNNNNKNNNQNNKNNKPAFYNDQLGENNTEFAQDTNLNSMVQKQNVKRKKK